MVLFLYFLRKIPKTDKNFPRGVNGIIDGSLKRKEKN
jgi:hypothetical protein